MTAYSVHAEITKVYKEEAWEISDRETGRNLISTKNTVYTSREEAEAAFDAVVASHNRHMNARLQQDADREARIAAEDAKAAVIEREGGPATERQINYIIRLLGERELSGNEAGFLGTQVLLSADGRLNHTALSNLTKRLASQYITSMTEDY